MFKIKQVQKQLKEKNEISIKIKNLVKKQIV